RGTPDGVPGAHDGGEVSAAKGYFTIAFHAWRAFNASIDHTSRGRGLPNALTKDAEEVQSQDLAQLAFGHPPTGEGHRQVRPVRQILIAHQMVLGGEPMLLPEPKPVKVTRMLLRHRRRIFDQGVRGRTRAALVRADPHVVDPAHVDEMLDVAGEVL